MQDGDCKNADGPHAPDNSSSIHDDPADAVPYMGSLRANDWSLHGCFFAMVIRRQVLRRPPEGVFG